MGRVGSDVRRRCCVPQEVRLSTDGGGTQVLAGEAGGGGGDGGEVGEDTDI